MTFKNSKATDSGSSDKPTVVAKFHVSDENSNTPVSGTTPSSAQKIARLYLR